MNNPGVYNLGDRTITAALTDQVVTEGSAISGAAQSFVDRLYGMKSVSLWVEFDYGSGGATCIVVVQTSLNQGDDWIDIARFDFATADSKKHANISADPAAAPAAMAALGAEGKLDGILGDRLRAKITSTGTYAGNTSVSVRAVAR